MKVAFIGMGLMGAPMAGNLLAAGHEVTVYNRTREKTKPLAERGAQVASTPRAAAEGKEAILICVEDTPDVEAVLFGEDGIVGGIDKEKPPLVIDHSTISAETTEDFARRLRDAAGARMLDAPVSGGDQGAKAGTLSIMVGGPREAFERAQPLLEAMGKTIVHIGERAGDGQRAKMVNQLVVALNCVATTEGLRLCKAMGLDGQTVLSAIGFGAAGSWSLNNLGPKLLAGDWAAGFRLRHLQKDIGFCHEAIAKATDAPERDYPGAVLVRGLIAQGVEAGHGDENIHAMARPLLKQNKD